MPNKPKQRTADPFRDTDVIDRNAARFSQGFTGLIALLGIVFGWPLAWALMAAQLLIGLTFGRQYCLPCLFYYTVVQPRLGEGELEDSRPPRLANMMGFAFMASAAAAWWLGSPTAGIVIAAMVTVLAALAASTGLCVGCEVYRLAARLRGIKPSHHDHIDPSDLPGLSAAGAYLEFTHPLCSECHEWERKLSSNPEPLLTVDVSQRSDLAHKYGVTVVPTVFRLAGDGEVLERLAP